MTFQLHSRLVALNVLAILVVTLILGYFLGRSLKTTLESEIKNQLYGSASLARLYVRDHPEQKDPVDLVDQIASALGVRVTLIDPNGRVLGDSEVAREGLAGVGSHSDRPEFVQARQSGRGAAVRTSDTLGTSFVYVTTILDDGNVLRVAMPLSTTSMLLNGLLRQLALAVLAATLLTFVLGYLVYRVVSLPLRRMADASLELAYGNLKTEIPVYGDRDLALLGTSLNKMAKTLQLRMEELHADKLRIEAIVAAMSAGVVVFEKNARVVLANSSVQALLDLHGDAAGKMPMELVRNPALETAVRGALSGADVPAIDVTTGSGKVLLGKARPVRALSGEVELVVVVFHDLTEIRKAERMRKDFVANVSHEFKTPLTSIRGYAETLLNSPPEDRNLNREFLEAIERNASLLHVLVEDLLVLARLESEHPVEKQPLPVRGLLEELVRTRDRQLKEKNISVNVECPSVEIMADRSRLTRAVSNLIDNAIHYNVPGGKIHIAGHQKPGHFSIDISDTGNGIPQEDLIRIFQRFYRVEKSRIRDSGGTGLGLAIAKHAIESQGGTISVKSKLGTGSTFTIFLPAA